MFSSSHSVMICLLFNEFPSGQWLKELKPSISVVVDLLLMGFKAHNPKIGPLNAEASETEGVSEKDRCRRNPLTFIFFLLPWNGLSEISHVKTAFFGPEGGRHSYQLQWNLGQEMCIRKLVKPLSSHFIFSICCLSPDSSVLSFSLQCFISLSRSLLFLVDSLGLRSFVGAPMDM